MNHNIEVGDTIYLKVEVTAIGKDGGIASIFRVGNAGSTCPLWFNPDSLGIDRVEKKPHVIAVGDVVRRVSNTTINSIAIVRAISEGEYWCRWYSNNADFICKLEDLEYVREEY